MVRPRASSRIGLRKSSAFLTGIQVIQKVIGEPAFEKYWPAFSGRSWGSDFLSSSVSLKTYFLATARQRIWIKTPKKEPEVGWRQEGRYFELPAFREHAGHNQLLNSHW